MKMKSVAILTFICFLVYLAQAQLDRSKVPGPGPAPAVAFPDYTLEKAPNGIRVIVVRNTKLPTVSMRLLIDRKPILEGDVAGYVDIAGQLLRNGTTTRTKDQIDDQIDLIGGNLGSNGTEVFASGLSKYTEKLFELMSDIILHPSFPQDELDKLVTQIKSELKHRKTEPNAIVEVVRQRLLYGDKHPYGEVESEETVGRITRAKCQEMYNAFFKPNSAILAVVGDVEKDAVMNLVKKYYSSWKEGTLPVPSYPTPTPLNTVKVAMVDRPVSVQSVVRVSQTVDLKRTSPDVVPVSVMNTILGGGVFRLFINLREKHAYTYGAYSSMGPDELIGLFNTSTSVKNIVTDSALTEIFYEIKRIREEKADAKELQMAKNYLSGSFVRSLENPGTVASYAIDIERYKLPSDYYKTYLKKVEAVTGEDVQRVAKQYLMPGQMLVTLVGSAKEVKEKAAKFGPVTMYDEEGTPVVEKAPSAVTMSPEEIFAKFIAKTGGEAKMDALKDRTVEMSGKMQNFDIKVKTVQKAPNKKYEQFRIVGMMDQTSVFDGQNGWASSPQGVKELKGEELEATRADAPINFYSHYKALGYKAEVAGLKQIKGKEYYEVTFTKASAPTLKHYFGKDDFLKFRESAIMTTPQGPMEQSVDLLDYKDFQGYLYPSRLEQNAMGQTIEMKVEKFEVNSGVEDKLFQKPAGK